MEFVFKADNINYSKAYMLGAIHNTYHIWAVKERITGEQSSAQLPQQHRGATAFSYCWHVKVDLAPWDPTRLTALSAIEIARSLGELLTEDKLQEFINRTLTPLPRLPELLPSLPVLNSQQLVWAFWS
jgi:hypothetical protein